jgi:hypothetical protein
MSIFGMLSSSAVVLEFNPFIAGGGAAADIHVRKWRVFAARSG